MFSIEFKKSKKDFYAKLLRKSRRQIFKYLHLYSFILIVGNIRRRDLSLSYGNFNKF